jgi:hypothetical protein
MRVYKFLPTEFGLKSIYERRLKQSQIKDLNDPYELASYDLSDSKDKKAFFDTRDQMHEDRGVLCFSATWHNPVIWAHYGDKHYGMCLGFDIPELEGDPHNCMRVKYCPKPLPYVDYEALAQGQRDEFIVTVLSAKFEG